MRSTPVPGQERREPGDRQDRAPAAGFQAKTAGRTQPDKAFSQLPQPGLGNTGEPQTPVSFEAEPVHAPDVTIVFAVPAVALGEVGDDAVSEHQQPAGVGVQLARPLPPAGFVVVEQRAHLGGDQQPHHPADDGRGDLAAALVVAALQRVLHLQPQRRRQRPQTDGLVGGQASRDEPVGELSRVRAAVAAPGVGVSMAER